jgi:small subunit ribosomal protein S8
MVDEMSKDLLTDAITIIRNAELVGKMVCKVPKSKLIENVLNVLREEKYIEDFKVLPEERKIEVKLLGKINDCKTIKPRLPVKKTEYEKYEARYLPAPDFGILVVTTSHGVISHRKAKEKNIGGKLLAYVY